VALGEQPAVSDQHDPFERDALRRRLDRRQGCLLLPGLAVVDGDRDRAASAEQTSPSLIRRVPFRWRAYPRLASGQQRPPRSLSRSWSTNAAAWRWRASARSTRAFPIRLDLWLHEQTNHAEAGSETPRPSPVGHEVAEAHGVGMSAHAGASSTPGSPERRDRLGGVTARRDGRALVTRRLRDPIHST
jgi:hypothetical protein